MHRRTFLKNLALAAAPLAVAGWPFGMAGSAAGPGWLRRGLPVENCSTC